MTDDHVARVAATVSGTVQGVGFRWFVVREARRLGLVGWVANAADGTVRLEAEGAQGDVDELIALLREGPPGARVADVAVAPTRPGGDESRFELRGLAHPGD
jgi:acylphosphatase